MTLQGQAIEAATQPWLLELLKPVLYFFLGWVLSEISAWRGERRATKREEQTDKRRVEAERAQFAAAVAAELEGLLRRYMQVAGERLGQAETSLQFPGGLLPRFNYFAVFDANLSKVGLLRPDDATRLVATYILAKGHMDDLITWGEVIRPSQIATTIRTFFGGLKRDHQQLVESVPEVVTLLRRYASSAVQR